MDQNTYANGDAPTPLLPILTRDRAKAQIHQEQVGYTFLLPYSGGSARVRRIPLAKLTSISGLSSEMQSQLMQVFADAREGRTTAETWADLARNQAQQEEMANAFCQVAFLEPTLVATQAEADAANSPSVLWVEEVDIRDRIAFLMSVLDPDSEAARAMAPFPEARLGGRAAGASVPAAETPVRPLVVPRGVELVPEPVPQV